MKLKTYLMSQNSILRLYAERAEINLNPVYQRNGDIWSLEKRQLLIDSLLNDFDIPKLYFHVIDSSSVKYAVIDGRQRLETVIDFIEGRFSLSDDFEYFADPLIHAGGLTYNQLAEKFPKLKIRFDSTQLPIVLVETDDEDLIDDMFSRLNEAAPLNAAEKRNAFGGAVVSSIVQLSNHPFFVDKVKFSNKRYQHREVAARILFLEYSIESEGKIFDTKKVYLDEFAKDKHKTFVNSHVSEAATELLTKMVPVFGDKDELLRSQSVVPIYYLLFRETENQSRSELFLRSKLADFRALLDSNRQAAEEDISKANYELLEFDRLSQQGTNDSSSIQKRLEILCDFVGVDKSLIRYV